MADKVGFIWCEIKWETRSQLLKENISSENIDAQLF